MDFHEAEAERDLRRLRQELRQDAEDLEAIAVESSDSQRALIDALVDAGMDGQEVLIDLPQRQIVGSVVHAGESVFSLETLAGVTLILVAEQVTGVRVGTKRGGSARVERGHPRSLLAALRAAVQDEQPVVIERTWSAPVQGVVEAVSTTHSQIREASGARWYVPLSAVVALRQP